MDCKSMTCPYLSAPHLLPPDTIFRIMAKQGVGIWLLRWICPSCGWRRPDHAEGCEVVRQGLR